MDTMILELPALTVLTTVLLPDPTWEAAGELTNFRAPVFPLKLCKPGEAVLIVVVVVMFGLGTVTADVPAGPKIVPLLKLVD